MICSFPWRKREKERESVCLCSEEPYEHLLQELTCTARNARSCMLSGRGKFTTPIQPAWLMRTDLCSCLGHLQNGCEAMADGHLVFVPQEQTHRGCSILKQIGVLSPDDTKVKLIANSLSAAKVAPTERAREAGSTECAPNLNCTKARSFVMLMRSS